MRGEDTSVECTGTETELVRSVTLSVADLQSSNEVNMRRQIATAQGETGFTCSNLHL